MSTLTRRAQVLFAPDQYDFLKNFAQAEGKSISMLIREAIAKTYQKSISAKKQSANNKIIDRWSKMNMPLDDWDVIENDYIQNKYKHND